MRAWEKRYESLYGKNRGAWEKMRQVHVPPWLYKENRYTTHREGQLEGNKHTYQLELGAVFGAEDATGARAAAVLARKHLHIGAPHTSRGAHDICAGHTRERQPEAESGAQDATGARAAMAVEKKIDTRHKGRRCDR
jgi:hypothetical protein